MSKLKDWCELLDQLKNELDIQSDAQLARRIGVSRSFISAIRVGRKNVSIEVAEKIFSLAGLDITEHLSGLFLPDHIYEKSEEFSTLVAQRQVILNRACGHCELCKAPSPFTLKDGTPYLEYSLIDLGEEKIAAALCPNCHKKMVLLNNEEDKKYLVKNIASKFP